MNTLNLDEQIYRLELELAERAGMLAVWRGLKEAGAVIQLPDQQKPQEGSDAIRNA